jgi:hypothetical protein
MLTEFKALKSVAMLIFAMRHFADLCKVCSMPIDDLRSIWIINTIKVWSQANKRACKSTVSACLTFNSLQNFTIFFMQFNVSLVKVSLHILPNQPKFRKAGQERPRHLPQRICYQIESPYDQEKNCKNYCYFF